jgi:hypothetical protein
VVWGYLFGFLLMLFVFLILLPDADGPSPWDPVAFRAGLLEMFANFRILDELADMGIIRVADVGEGILNVDLDLIGVSNRKFGVAPFYLAIVFATISLLLRGIRQRLLAGRAGFGHEVKGQMSSFFLGRGMNLFFPFGPGDLAITQTLDGEGTPSEAAADVVFHNRLFELLGILTVLLIALVYLGWGGAVTTVLWTLILTVAVVSLTQPLGWTENRPARRSVRGMVSAAFNGPALWQGLRRFLASPSFLLGVLALSVLALLMEIGAYWWIKQAFSSPMDDYVLMKDLPFMNFAIVVAGASITRILPYTFASFGIYETASVVMFRVMGEGFLGGITVTLLDSILINVLTLIFFLFAMRVATRPSILETWRLFYRQSVDRITS